MMLKIMMWLLRHSMVPSGYHGISVVLNGSQWFSMVFVGSQ